MSTIILRYDLETMLMDHLSTLKPPATPEEIERYRQQVYRVYQLPKVLSPACALRLKAQESTHNLKTRIIQCNQCHASYYYDPGRSFEGKCYYCDSEQITLEDALVIQIPPWVNPSTHVWYQ
jgi:hypothetical protein